MCKTVVEDINSLFLGSCACGCSQDVMNGLGNLDDLYAKLDELNKELEGRIKRRGECSKYWTKGKRNDCRKKNTKQQDEIKAEIALVIDQIKIAQAQQNSGGSSIPNWGWGNSGNTGGGNSGNSGNGNASNVDIIPNIQQQAGIGNNVLMLGLLAAGAGFAYKKWKDNRK